MRQQRLVFRRYGASFAENAAKQIKQYQLMEIVTLQQIALFVKVDDV